MPATCIATLVATSHSRNVYWMNIAVHTMNMLRRLAAAVNPITTSATHTTPASDKDIPYNHHETAMHQGLKGYAQHKVMAMQKQSMVTINARIKHIYTIQLHALNLLSCMPESLSMPCHAVIASCLVLGKFPAHTPGTSYVS